MAKPHWTVINTQWHSYCIKPGIFKELFRSIEKLRHKRLVHSWNHGHVGLRDPKSHPESESKACVSWSGRHTLYLDLAWSCCYPSLENHCFPIKLQPAYLQMQRTYWGRGVGGEQTAKERWPSLCHLHTKAWRLLGWPLPLTLNVMTIICWFMGNYYLRELINQVDPLIDASFKREVLWFRKKSYK